MPEDSRRKRRGAYRLPLYISRWEIIRDITRCFIEPRRVVRRENRPSSLPVHDKLLSFNVAERSLLELQNSLSLSRRLCSTRVSRVYRPRASEWNRAKKVSSNSSASLDSKNTRRKHHVPLTLPLVTDSRHCSLRKTIRKNGNFHSPWFLCDSCLADLQVARRWMEHREGDRPVSRYHVSGSFQSEIREPRRA